MKNATIECLVLGMVSTSTWLIQNKETKEVLIIDPADNASAIVRKVEQMGGVPKAVLLTHGHFDHIMAADDLRDAYDIPIYAYADEKMVLTNARINLSGSWASPYTLDVDCVVRDNDSMQLAGFDIQVLHTPGHTLGSCCYYIKEEGVLFSGDTLFAGSIGRTDFPTSNMGHMRASLRRLLTNLPGETVVYPGHGEETTIAYEKRYNPFA